LLRVGWRGVPSTFLRGKLLDAGIVPARILWSSDGCMNPAVSFTGNGERSAESIHRLTRMHTSSAIRIFASTPNRGEVYPRGTPKLHG
jgi:hypothetical protein